MNILPEHNKTEQRKTGLPALIQNRLSGEYKNMDNTENSWNNIEYYTVDDVSRILKLGKTKTYQLFKNDAFPYMKIGGSLRVRKDLFMRWSDTYTGRNFEI